MSIKTFLIKSNWNDNLLNINIVWTNPVTSLSEFIFHENKSCVWARCPLVVDEMTSKSNNNDLIIPSSGRKIKLQNSSWYLRARWLAPSFLFSFEREREICQGDLLFFTIPRITHILSLEVLGRCSRQSQANYVYYLADNFFPNNFHCWKAECYYFIYIYLVGRDK